MYLDKNIGESPRNQKKWLVMKLKMDGYDASLCKSTWDSTCSFSQGFYFLSLVFLKCSSFCLYIYLLFFIFHYWAFKFSNLQVITSTLKF